MKEQIDKAELQEFVITLSDCQHKFDKEVNKAIVTGTPLPKENQFYARYLMEQGYRKQEWISVDERLPNQKESVLVCDEIGDVYTDFIEFDWKWSKEISRRWGIKYVYWMPLPEPPKMKGGAE